MPDEPSRQTDRELTELAQGGDAAAFHALVDRYGSAMFGLAVSLVGQAADAEDVVQEAFTAAYQQIGRYEGRAQFKTWLTRIVVIQAARHHRRAKVRKTVPLPAGDAAPASVARAGDNPEARMDAATLLATLGEEHRQVIVLRELQGLTYQEIAEVLDLPQGTVESRIFRARQILRDRFREFLE